MADVNFKVVRFLINNSTGNQDVTISGFGTPKAAIFIAGANSADNTVEGLSRISYGFTDGVREGCSSVRSTDNAATTAVRRIQSDSSVINILSPLAIFIKANFVSWITDGVRINVTSAPSSPRYATIVLINGSDVTDAYVDNVLLNSSVVDITAPSFEPDLVLMSTVHVDVLDTSSNSNLLSMGVCVNDGSNTQSSTSWRSASDSLSTAAAEITSSSKIISQITDTAITYSSDIDTFDANGFSINSSIANPNDYIVYLALKFSNNPDISLSVVDSPTATGSKSYSAGFEPSFAMFLTNDTTSVDTVQNSGQDGFSVYATDSSSEFSHSYSERDAAATTVTKELTSSSFKQLTNGTDTQFEATSSGFTGSGIDFNFTTVDATPRKWISLFIGDAASGAISIDDLISNSDTSSNTDAIALSGAFNISDKSNNSGSASNQDTVQFASAVLISDSSSNSSSISNVDGIILVGAFNVQDINNNTSSLSNIDLIALTSAVIISDNVNNSDSQSTNDIITITDQLLISDSVSNSSSISQVDGVLLVGAVTISENLNNTDSLSNIDTIQIGDFIFKVIDETNINGQFLSANINGVHQLTNVDGVYYSTNING